MGIIEDLINISKIESGLMTLNITEVNLSEVLSFMYNFFKPETEARGLKLSLNGIESCYEIIRSDKEKIYAILTNLIKNAIKFTDAGSIKISCKNLNDTIQFSVKDTGIGIPKHKQSIIFERFVQVDTSLSSSYEGWGLGLAITKAYLKMLGGEIWMESVENNGTTFFFTLPKIYSRS